MINYPFGLDVLHFIPLLLRFQYKTVPYSHLILCEMIIGAELAVPSEFRVIGVMTTVTKGY